MSAEHRQRQVEIRPHPLGSSVEVTDYVGPWVVSMSWAPNQDRAAGPSSVLITFDDEGWADEHNAESERGITSGTLRRVEAVLVSATAAVREILAPVLNLLLADYQTALADLGTHPLADDRDAYYAALYRAWHALTTHGDRTPNKTLAAQLNLSPETVRTQLKKARKRAAEQGSK